jgi:selenocysteine-specific translation elongation factor
MSSDKKQIGKVTHYFSKINVAGIQLSGTLKVGDKISIEGATTAFEENIESMQIDNKAVIEAKAGDTIGIKVKDKTRVGDNVFIIQE